MTRLMYDPTVIAPYYDGTNWQDACRQVGWAPKKAVRAKDALDIQFGRNRFASGKASWTTTTDSLPSQPFSLTQLHGLVLATDPKSSIDPDYRTTDALNVENVEPHFTIPMPHARFVDNISNGTMSRHAGTIPGATATTQDEFLRVIEPHAIIMSDLHVPKHDSRFMEYALDIAYDQSIRTLIIVGDFFDFPQFRKPNTFYQSSIAQNDIILGEKVLEALLDYFDNIYITTGNHDKWLYRHLGGHFEPEFLFSRLVNTDQKRVEWSLKGHKKTIHWTDKEAISLLSHQTEWWLAHGRNYSRSNPLRVVREIADLRSCSTLVGHQHHAQSGLHPNGRWNLVSLGCMADPSYFDYCNTGSETNPKMTQSFCVIHEGRPLLYHR